MQQLIIKPINMHTMNDKMKIFSLLFCFCLCSLDVLRAQSGLIVQGAIQNASGTPLPDGNHRISFRLYENETGGTPVWSETQASVPVSGGLYSTSLGASSPLSVPFNKIYYLGVSVNGGNELVPRARLSPSPYAVSLRGENNLFPASGPVGVGTLTPNTGTELHLKKTDGSGQLLIEGDNGAVLRFKQGGNTADISYDGDKITVANLNLTISDNLNLPAGAAISYNGLNGWRLVDTDNFETGDDGWTCVDDWTNNTARTFSRFTPNTPFSREYILRPNQSGNDVMKKKFDLTGVPHTQIKVVFTYHFFDTWDAGANLGWAGFASRLSPYTAYNQSNGYFQMGWVEVQPDGFSFGGAGYVDFEGSNIAVADCNLTREMIAQHTSDEFWVLFGSNLDQSVADESYGISHIEIWVQ